MLTQLACGTASYQSNFYSAVTKLTSVPPTHMHYNETDVGIAVAQAVVVKSNSNFGFTFQTRSQCRSVELKLE